VGPLLTRNPNPGANGSFFDALLDEANSRRLPFSPGLGFSGRVPLKVEKTSNFIEFNKLSRFTHLQAI
jgi:hypothetical protein